MVRFEEDGGSIENKLYVDRDPARIYRGLKDMLVEEFDVDRIEEERMEFNVEKPKDRVRLNAYKEKSPHTLIRYNLSLKCKRPDHIFQQERPDNIFLARTKVDAVIITVYPGGDPIEWLPQGMSEKPDKRWANRAGLEAEERTNFQRSRLYRILVGIWYKKFYSREITRYEEEAKETMIRIQNLMREKFGVEEVIGRTGASQYQPPWK